MAKNYGWIITRDNVCEGKDVGVMGPSAMSDAVVTALTAGKGVAWRAYDGDGEWLYSGRYIDSPNGNEFAPLDNFAGPNAGATELRYRQADGTWKTL